MSTNERDLPEIPPDRALLDLLECVIMNDEATRLPRCGSLIRRAKALGWLRDRDLTRFVHGLPEDARTLVPTELGMDVYRRWCRA